jgi:hypothetical protein
MTKDGSRSLAVLVIVIPLGGLLMMALTLVVYGILFNLFETLFFPNNSLSFPAGPFRMIFTIAMVLLYLLLLRTQLSEMLKAILLTVPLSAVTITIGNALNERPSVSIPAMLVAIAICGLLLYRFKKPWIYYYAGAIASLVALAYAWPRLP